MLTHGHTRGGRLTREYNAWRAMKDRCLRPKCKQYRWYGARGITICARWLHSFEAFIADMGPAHGLTLDRRDSNGNYELGNCRWATQEAQCNNKRNNIHVVIDGASLTPTQAARQYHVPHHTVRRRAAKGLTDHAVLEPLPRPTHCRQGHPWVPENTMIRADGRRLCRTCREAIVRKHNAQQQQKRKHQGQS